MVHSPVPAGTIFYLDFDDFGFQKPEMAGTHPVVVVSPESKQSDGTAIVIPLTSAIGNSRNSFAVEVTNQSFAATSPTGRSFAVCDKPVCVSLERLRPYTAGRKQGSNHAPNYQLKGDDLKTIRLVCFRAISSDEDFRKMTSNGILKTWIEKLRQRQKMSRHRGRAAVAR